MVRSMAEINKSDDSALNRTPPMMTASSSTCIAPGYPAMVSTGIVNGLFAATGCRSRCSEITGPSRRGGLVGVIRRTSRLLRGCFFAFRFVSDFRRRHPVVIIAENFSDGPSETKCPSVRNEMAPLKRAGNGVFRRAGVPVRIFRYCNCRRESACCRDLALTSPRHRGRRNTPAPGVRGGTPERPGVLPEAGADGAARTGDGVRSGRGYRQTRRH